MSAFAPATSAYAIARAGARRASRSTRAETSAAPALANARPTRRAWPARPRRRRAGRPSASAARSAAGGCDRGRSRSTSSCGLTRDEQVVEVAPTRRGTTLHHLEVVGREHGDPQRTEQVARPRESLPVHLHPVAAPHRSSASISSSRSSPFDVGAHDARSSHPCAPSASVGAPRNDCRAARGTPTASSRFVLPCPLAPMTAVRPGGELELERGRSSGSRSSQSRRRQHAARRLTTPARASAGTGSRRLGRPQRRPASAGRPSRARPRRCRRPRRRREVPGLNATVMLRAFVLRVVERPRAAWPTSWVIAIELEPSALIARRTRCCSARRDELHATDRVEQRLLAHREPVRVAARDELLGSSGTRPRSGAW